MKPDALVDTGALLALLDERDRWHGICIEAAQKLRLPLATSQAVLTELFYMVGNSRYEMEKTWRLLRTGTIVMLEIANSELSPISELMSQYADRPMDFADATLVHLAKREGLSTIFTVDHADFETYRIEGRRKFRVVPVNRPH